MSENSESLFKTLFDNKTITVFYAVYYLVLVISVFVYASKSYLASIIMVVAIILLHFLFGLCKATCNNNGIGFREFLKKRYGPIRCTERTIEQKVDIASDLSFVAALLIAFVAFGEFVSRDPSTVDCGTWWLLWATTVFGNTLCMVRHGCCCFCSQNSSDTEEKESLKSSIGISTEYDLPNPISEL